MREAFTIDLNAVFENRDVQMGFVERMQNVALPAILEYGKLLISSMGEAFYTNVCYMWDTIQIVFSGFSGSAEELMCRLGGWVVLHIIGFITVTIYVFIKNMNALPRVLLSYADFQINTKHIKAKDTTIDVSHVPPEIRVDVLLEIFEKINFTDCQQPGYMDPASLKEGERVYTLEELRQHLNNFVHRVNTHEAFLGTPSAWNIALLAQFYSQIENAVRFSLHKVLKDVNEFTANNQSPSEKAHENDDRYNDLLQAKARLAIDMAIAGAHCGARYMGDSMDAYFFHKGEVAGQTLEDDLNAVLAKKREEMARRHIQQYLGQDVHSFTEYMANLGGLLGIPGTENVIEQLGQWGFNRAEMLSYFFNDYTPNFIRDSVQEKISTSQTFRERIYDWLKDHGGNWSQAVYQEKQKAVLDAIRAVPLQADSPIPEQVKALENLTTTLVTNGVIVQNSTQLQDNKGNSLPDYNTQWSEFLDEVICLGGVRDRLHQQLGTSELTVQQKATAKNQWKTMMVDPLFAPALQQMVGQIVAGQKAEADIAALVQVRGWMSAVNQALVKQEVSPIPADTLMRCFQEQANFEDVLAAHLENQRHAEFLGALEPDKAHHLQMEGMIQQINAVQQTNKTEWAAAVNDILVNAGLQALPAPILVKCYQGNMQIETVLASRIPHKINPKILEWVLVAHGILNPPTTAEQRVDS